MAQSSRPLYSQRRDNRRRSSLERGRRLCATLQIFGGFEGFSREKLLKMVGEVRKFDSLEEIDRLGLRERGEASSFSVARSARYDPCEVAGSRVANHAPTKLQTRFIWPSVSLSDGDATFGSLSHSMGKFQASFNARELASSVFDEQPSKKGKYIRSRTKNLRLSTLNLEESEVILQEAWRPKETLRCTPDLYSWTFTLAACIDALAGKSR